MIRHELIPIHTNVQHFVECAQLEVLGVGTESPGKEYLVKFPGGYRDDGEFLSKRVSGCSQVRGQR